MSKNDIVFTTRETAKLLKCSERFVRMAIKDGSIKASILGKRLVRVPLSEIERISGASK